MIQYLILSIQLMEKYLELQLKVQKIFPKLCPPQNTQLKGEMIKSKLPNNVLGKIWKLSDVDKDGLLDIDEFALAMHLINIKVDGKHHYTSY